MATLALAVPVMTARAQSLGRITTTTTAPIAPRGGVLMLPLRAQRPGAGWPETLTLHLADGSRIDGHVAWVHAAPPSGPRHWTEDPRGLVVRLVRPDDDTSVQPVRGVPYVLARLPDVGEGTIRLERQRLDPTWIDVPTVIDPWQDPETLDSPMPRVWAPDRPDPESPFEYWRWVLLADRLGRLPPPPPDDDEAVLLTAEHYADLWRIGLRRLALHSRGVALSCRDLLTRVCRDESRPVAGWTASAQLTNALLTALLNKERTNDAIVAEALAWVDTQQPVLLWMENDADEAVTVALINRGTRLLVARFTWPGLDEIPIAVELPAGELRREVVHRPQRHIEDIRTRVGMPETLRVEFGQVRVEMQVGARVIAVQPPGLSLSPLRPPFSLAEVQAGLLRPADTRRSTWATVRHLSGRWEVFFDCRRPESPIEETLPTRIGDRLPRGHEAVTLFIGPREGSETSMRLVVPESGWWQLEGATNDGTLQIHRVSYDDRWYCRIVIPDTWLDTSARTPSRFAFARTHASDDGVETAPALGVPWAEDPARISVDLSAWDHWKR